MLFNWLNKDTEIVNEENYFSYRYKRKKIIKDSKKYKSKFIKYMDFDKFDVDDEESGSKNMTDFLDMSRNYDYFEYCYLKLSLTKTEINEIYDIINQINSELDDYHFTLDMRYGNCIKVELGKGKEVKLDNIKFPTRDDYNNATKVAKELLSKYPTIKKAFSVTPYEQNEELAESSITIMYYDTWKLWSKHRRTSDEYDQIFEKPFEKFFYELKNELKKYKLELDSDGDEDNGFLYIRKNR